LIVELTGFDGRIIRVASRPDGQPRRMLDTTKALRKFGFTAKTDFGKGLQRTIRWYKELIKS
jgi:GDP-L-fucose synthase